MSRRLSRALVAPLLLALLVAARAGAEEESRWSFHSELDLFLGLKAGAELRFPGDWGIRGSLGFCLISPLQTSWTLVAAWHLLPRDSSFQPVLELGLVQSIFNVLEPWVDLDPDIDWASAYFVPGVCLALGWRIARGHVLSIRAGGGVLFGWDIGRWQGPQFQPNIAIEYDLELP